MGKQKRKEKKERDRQRECVWDSSLENCLENRSLKKNESLSDCAKICCQAGEPKKFTMIDRDGDRERERER